MQRSQLAFISDRIFSEKIEFPACCTLYFIYNGLMKKTAENLF